MASPVPSRPEASGHRELSGLSKGEGANFICLNASNIIIEFHKNLLDIIPIFRSTYLSKMKSKLLSVTESKYYTYSIAIFICILWLYMSMQNHLHDDDLVMIKEVQTRGIWGTMLHFYHGWNTRWASYLLQGFWYAQWTEKSSPIAYNLTTAIVLFTSVYILVNIFIKRLEINMKKSNTILITLVLIAGLTLSTFNKHETWFWVSGSTMYGWNLISTIILISCYFSRSTILNNLTSIIASIYIGGTSEPYFMSLLLLGIILFYYQYKLSRKQSSTLILFLIFGTISFVIAYLGKGHEIRSSALPSLSIMEVLIRSIYFFAKLLFVHFPVRILLTGISLFPLYYLGQSIQKKVTVNKHAFIQKQVKPILIGFLLMSYLHCIMLTYIMGSYGPDRCWSGISLFMTISWGYLLFEGGRNMLISNTLQ